MKTGQLTRRELLRGMLAGSAVALSLPWLESMTGTGAFAHATPSGFPTRFGLFYWGNGNIPDRWTPDTVGEDFSLSEQLMPLEAIKHKICVVSGMSLKVENLVPHSSGAAGMLSGQALLNDDRSSFAGPSIDQIIANEVGSQTIYSSLQTGGTDVDGLSYNGTSNRNPPETDPYAFYTRLFGDTFVEPGEGGLVDPSLGLRRSVLDAVLDDIHQLDARVSTADRVRLEQHYTGVRELEQRLAKLEKDPPDLESCARPNSPKGDYGDIDGRPQIAARNQVMCEMIAMSLACDQTRVIGHYLTDPLTNILFPDATSGHHDLTHNEGGTQPEVNANTIHCIEQLATFLQVLDSVPEGEGTLLDHCSILACSEVSLGQTHSLDEMPIVLAGGGDGHFRTGYHYRSYSQDNVSKVLLTLVQSMGIIQGELGSGDAYTDQVLSDVVI